MRLEFCGIQHAPQNAARGATATGRAVPKDEVSVSFPHALLQANDGSNRPVY
jgi:hypothetical protein